MSRSFFRGLVKQKNVGGLKHQPGDEHARLLAADRRLKGPPAGESSAEELPASP